MLYRLRDIVFSILMLVLLSWLFLLILLVLLFTQGKIFFTQLRIGKDGKPFRLVKFSTLRDVKPGHDEAADQRHRLTPAGKILRRFSLDELPQFWNVLKGEMSVVGPRPLLPEYMELYSEEEKTRHNVKPGLTGWAQINGRNKLSWKQRFALDIWYVRNRSFGLDCKIMLLTPLRMLSGGDVYADGSTTMPKYDGTN